HKARGACWFRQRRPLGSRAALYRRVLGNASMEPADTFRASNRPSRIGFHHEMTLDSLLTSVQSRSLTELVGNTPLVPIEGLEGVSARVRVLGKAEWFNPGGSVKDRAALAMVREGLASGGLGSGRTLIDATSGNTGISYAW